LKDNRKIPRALAVFAAVGALVMLFATPSSAANERDNVFFSDSGAVCIEGINATTVLGSGYYQFQSATRSLQLDCSTSRSLAANNISTTTGLRIINGTYDTRWDCAWFPKNWNSSTASRVDAPYIQYSSGPIREWCGVDPSSTFVGVGANSYHQARVWGTWWQNGSFRGAVSNLI